jgi:hypothetical protein
MHHYVLKMKRAVFAIIIASACAQQETASTDVARKPPYCESPRRIAALPAELNEASGVAVSRRHPDILWAHNDSGEPVLFAIDTTGTLRGRVRVEIRNNDWEDIAVAPCGTGSCIYIGAIGDNRHNRTDRAVYRLREPALDGAARIDGIFRYRLPERAEDAEALIVLPEERIFIVTKGRSGAITMFAFPERPSTESVNVLEPIQALTTKLVQLPDMVTGGGATPDGRTIVLRSYSALQLYSFDNATLTPLLDATGFALESLDEYQGEGVDISANGTVYLVSEKGLSDEAPPLSRVTCVLSAR